MWPPADKSLNARLKDKVLWDVQYRIRSEVISPAAGKKLDAFKSRVLVNFADVEHSLNAKLKRYRL